MKDGIVFERLYMAEVQHFADTVPDADISHDDVMAAVLLRDAGRLEVLQLLYSRKLKAKRCYADDDDTADDVELKST